MELGVLKFKNKLDSPRWRVSSLSPLFPIDETDDKAVLRSILNIDVSRNLHPTYLVITVSAVLGSWLARPVIVSHSYLLWRSYPCLDL